MAYVRKSKLGVVKVATTIYLEQALDAALVAAAVKDGRLKGPFIVRYLKRKFLPAKRILDKGEEKLA